MNVYMCMFMRVHVCMQALLEARDVRSLELELQMIVGSLRCVLGTELSLVLEEQ